MRDSQVYSHLDIERYLQRQMSPKEMHAFEKALMDDPFLADAIEGFSASDSAVASKHLLEIESELTQKNEKAKVVPLVVRKTGWWKVAAIVLVVVTGAALSYSLLNKKEGSPQLADQTVVVKEKELAAPPDSIGPQEKPLAKLDAFPRSAEFGNQRANPPFKNSAAIESKKTDKETEPSAAVALEGRAAGVSVTNPNLENTSLMAARSAAPANDSTVIVGYSTARKRSPTQLKLEFKGKVLDTAGEPLPFASIRVSNTDIGTIADARGNFTLQAPDSIVHVQVTSAGFATAITEVKSNATLNKIVLQQDVSSLSDVVVTDLQSKKEKRIGAIAKNENTAEPEGGWKTFDHYLHRQIDSLRTGTQEFDYDQDIVFEFSIDKNGRPTDIQSTEPVDKKVADKVKEILLKGPAWKNTKKEKKVKVIIPF